MNMQQVGGNSPVEVRIDFPAITGLFATAREQGRSTLLEHETYELLRNSGAETPPRTKLLARGSRPSDEELMVMPGPKVVLKIVSPAIIHKTEVGGVKVVEKSAEKIRSAWRRMLYEVPENYARLLERDPGHTPQRSAFPANACYKPFPRIFRVC